MEHRGYSLRGKTPSYLLSPSMPLAHMPINQCLYGETPFIGKDREITKCNIVHYNGTMKFVPNSRIERRYRVSEEAQDLISRLLQSKPSRLSCQAYGLNDMYRFRASETAAWSHALRPHFVYPNDAADIKAHPFFAGLKWGILHLMTPPEIPKLRHNLDTRYFELAELSKESTASQFSSVASAADGGLLKSGPFNVGPTNRHGKGRKRPRDCILRDRGLVRDALELRKKGALLGYAHQRPHEILNFLAGVGAGRRMV